MNTIATLSQIIIALGIFNVWLIRYGKPSAFRGGQASNLREEFEVYGLPHWFMQVIGGLKLLLAALLIIGLWIPGLAEPAAIGMAFLMLGAIIMHFKVKDPLKKSVPAFTIIVLCFLIVVG